MILSGDWLTDRRTQAVFSLLAEAGHVAFAVGGCVRNALMGVPVADIDIATSARPDTVSSLAEAAGIRAIPTGIAHGTVTLVIGGTPFEVTTFRRDVETDGRRAVVAYGADIAEDARRRDFTVNALYADASGHIHDPLGGLPDVEARLIRFVGDPSERIREDALRMLRFFRFHAWYGDPDGGLDPEALAAIADLSETAEALSKERVGAEIRKLLAAPDPAQAVCAMEASGLLHRVLPGSASTMLAPLVAVESPSPPDWHRRLAALGGQDLSDNLRLSRTESTRLAAIRAALERGAPPALAAYRHGQDAARDAALIAASLSGHRPDDLETELARGARARFPVRAADIEGELVPGPAMGAALKEMEETWIASNFTLSQQALLSHWRARRQAGETPPAK